MAIEQYSIGFIPLDKRYGHESRLFTIWLSINLSIVCFTVGTLGIVAGLALGWTILALLIGNLVGTAFMAAHSAQGPHLGVPQMVQSRAQFGVLGAAIPLIAVIITYTLYTSADAVVIHGTIESAMRVNSTAAMVGFGLLTLIVAFVGYELIHRIGAVMAIASGLLFVATATILAISGSRNDAWAPVHSEGFSISIFMATITQATAWSLTFGPYVADYSRYLPDHVSISRTFWYTGAGNAIGAFFTMSLGAAIASYYPTIASDPGLGLTRLFGPAALIIEIIIIMGVFQGNVMNLYSAYMSTATVIEAMPGTWAVGRRTKFIVMVIVIVIATAIAIFAANNFDRYFGDMLNVMVYLLVPWSAINLSDYYMVRHGTYQVDDLFRSGGRYGSYNVSTILIYGFSIICEAPFIKLNGVTGPIAYMLGADIGWIPGLLIPAILYPIFERRKLKR